VKFFDLSTKNAVCYGIKVIFAMGTTVIDKNYLDFIAAQRVKFSLF
jgi:hypothetical protein